MGYYYYAAHHINYSFAIDENRKTLMGFKNGKKTSLHAEEIFGNKLRPLIEKAYHSVMTAEESPWGYAVQPPKPILSHLMINGIPHVVVVCAFTAEDTDIYQLVNKQRPVFVLTRAVDEKMTAYISALTGLEQLRANSDPSEISATHYSVMLSDNKKSFWFLWNPSSPVVDLLKVIIPSLLISLLFMAYCCWRFFIVQMRLQKSIENQLLENNHSLEKRVTARAKSLIKANKKLNQEVILRREIEQEILFISEREQNNLGQEIHDGLCQNLLGIKFACEKSERDLANSNKHYASKFRTVAELITESLDHAHDIAKGLSPLLLSDQSLDDAILELTRRTKRLFNIDCQLHCKEQINIDQTDIVLHIYRIAQEAINNAIKHANATTISIYLYKQDNSLVMDISDNGSGVIEPSFFTDNGCNATSSGMGLKIMRYRADIAGGHLNIISQLGQGTTIRFLRNHSSYQSEPV